MVLPHACLLLRCCLRRLGRMPTTSSTSTATFARSSATPASSATALTTRRGRPACGWIRSKGRPAKLESGATAVVPGKRAESELIRRITSTDADEKMPPEGQRQDRSRREQIELLRKWIEQGAEFKPHWSFVAPAAAARCRR